MKGFGQDLAVDRSHWPDLADRGVAESFCSEKWRRWEKRIERKGWAFLPGVFTL